MVTGKVHKGEIDTSGAKNSSLCSSSNHVMWGHQYSIEGQGSTQRSLGIH